jgi:O-antigen/teichoic acid export membrane protein
VLVSDTPAPVVIGTESTREVDRVGRRSAYKLLGNAVDSLSRVVVQAVVPRTLGPLAYGDYVFLTNFFSTLVGSLGLATPMALNTRIAQRPADAGLTTFYTYVIGAIAVLIAAFIALTGAFGLVSTIWPGQAVAFICAAAVWALLSWMTQVVTGVADAHGATAQTERLRISRSIVSAAAVLLIFAAGLLNLWTLFVYQYAVFGALIIAVVVSLRRTGHAVLTRWRLTLREAAIYGREFYTFSHPLIVYTTVGFVANTGERWLLQRFAGAGDQAFYGLSYQIGSLCFLFTSAFLPVIMREFAVAARSDDRAAMAGLFRRYVPLLYSVAAFLSAFVATEADRVILLFGGPGYRPALVPMIIMSFFPIHQTYGQLSGALFFATGRTALYRNIGLFSYGFGMVLAYLLVAPPSLGGLGAGAPGLALKMVVLQLVAVNIQLYFNARMLGLRFTRYLAHQAASIACLLGLALAARVVVGALLAGAGGVIGALAATAMVYAVVVAVVVGFAPPLFGLRSGDLRRGLRSLTAVARLR